MGDYIPEETLELSYLLDVVVEDAHDDFEGVPHEQTHGVKILGDDEVEDEAVDVNVQGGFVENDIEDVANDASVVCAHGEVKEVEK